MVKALTLVVCMLCAWAGITHAHSFGHDAKLATVTSLDDVVEYLEHYRQDGDDEWLHAVDPFFAKKPGDERARWHWLRAWHAQAQHRFDDALDYLTPLMHSSDPAVWLMTANLHRIRGRIETADSSCRRVLGHQILLGKLCLLQNALTQQMKPSEKDLKVILKLLDHQRLQTQAEESWVYGVLADAYAFHRDLSAAVVWSGKAFQLNPSVQSRARYADLLIDQGHLDQALAVIGTTAKAPSLAVLRLKALTMAEPDKDLSQAVSAVDKQFRQHIQAHDWLHAREMAEFYLDILPDPALAKELAHRNWQYQREAEDRMLLTRTQNL